MSPLCFFPTPFKQAGSPLKEKARQRLALFSKNAGIFLDIYRPLPLHLIRFKNQWLSGADAKNTTPVLMITKAASSQGPAFILF